MPFPLKYERAGSKGKGSNSPAAVLEAGHNLGIFGVYFSVFWVCFRSILGVFWVHFSVFWLWFGCVLGIFWVCFWGILGVF